MIVADFVAERIERRGIRYVFGVGGANIEDMFAAVQRRRPNVRAVLNKHEHAAGIGGGRLRPIDRRSRGRPGDFGGRCDESRPCNRRGARVARAAARHRG